MSQRSEHQGELSQMSQDYSLRLLETISRINFTWRTLCNVAWEESAFCDLQTTVHKLAGTARSYGFEELGDRLITLDRLFREIHKTGIPAEAKKQQINLLLTEITELANKPASSMPPLPSSISMPSRASELIYIVDDDEDASRYIQAILKTAGYITEAFSLLTDFYQALERKQPDLIIMDIVFPEGTLAGIEAINQLGAELGKTIPIIFISIRSDIQARVRALRAGGCAYINKPIEPETLLSVVDSNSRVEQNHKRIVVIDDDPVALKYFETLMKKNHYEVMSSEDPAKTLNLIESFQADVVVMDYNMPGYNGEELVTMLHQDKRYLNLPVIMVTGDTDPEVEQRVRQLRNTCFIKKPIDNDLFLETIAESIEQACRSKKTMLSVLKHYPLGLLNLYYFYSELESLISTVNKNDTPYTLLYLAIDDPASIREHVGLKNLVELNNQVSRYLLSLVDRNELVSQLTEFVYLVLIKIENPSRLKASIEPLKNKIKNKVFSVDGIETTIKTSIGAISINSKIGSIDQAIKLAEQASLEANKSGGDQIRIEVPGQKKTTIPGSDIERRFMTAFNDDKLRLAYQPIININTSKTIYEAYARFEDGEKILSPSQFMPFIEDNKLEADFNKKLTLTALDVISGSAGFFPGLNKKVVIIKLNPGNDSMLEHLDWFEAYMDSHDVKIDNNLIFSFQESWVLKNHKIYKRLMDQSAKYNYGLALDQAGNSIHTTALVKAIEPAFTKLSLKFTEQLLSRQPGKTHGVLKKLQTLHTCIVAGSVENVEMFSSLMALGIHCFQGYIVQQPEANLGFSISEHYI